MKKNLLFILVLCCSFSAFSDTIDHVQVYLNDQLLTQFNPTNEYYNVNIEESTFKESDKISIKYYMNDGNDKTVYIYNIVNQKNQPLNDIVTRKNGSSVTINRSFLGKDLPIIKGNVYYFTVTKILNMQEQAPERVLKITLQ
ncbi:MAG: hypothetical protein RBS29_04530 [Bacteroidales bacterium]|jgi:hypothetical protein|nr:hypothetical protein [Bacteroidales bacterium]